MSAGAAPFDDRCCLLVFLLLLALTVSKESAVSRVHTVHQGIEVLLGAGNLRTKVCRFRSEKAREICHAFTNAAIINQRTK